MISRSRALPTDRGSSNAMRRIADLFMAYYPMAIGAEIGDVVEVHMDVHAVHLFDLETTLAIAAGRD
ncbi:MAG: hypothetical protein HN403_16475 [Rhodospirillales bacterium]|nr:hypothetical protein [Rhodospirillales bacterium]